MNPTLHKMVSDLITEYGNSLARADGERELQKQIAEKAEAMGAKPAVFKKTATAYYRNKVADLREATQEQLDFLELVQ